MKVKTKVKAGGHNLNHNETGAGIKVKTRVKAGRLVGNHSQSQR